jgi:hypothetical protein
MTIDFMLIFPIPVSRRQFSWSSRIQKNFFCIPATKGKIYLWMQLITSEMIF